MMRLFLFLLFTVGLCVAQDAPPAHEHMDSVHRHGEMAMGFSQTNSTHHFRLTDQGGYVEAVANDPKDADTQNKIRMHLQHIAEAFKAGDFSAPELTHSQTPPGVPTMQQLKADIRYTYVPVDGGGRLIIQTKNAEALRAIHDFLKFQIKDHETGDSSTVQH